MPVLLAILSAASCPSSAAYESPESAFASKVDRLLQGSLYLMHRQACGVHVMPCRHQS